MRIAEYSIRYQDRKVPHQLAPESIEELNTFSKARETLLAQKVALQNQLREAESHDPRSFKQLKDLYQANLKALDKSLLKIESELQSNLEKNQEIKTNMDLLKSIPGIGKQTALQFIIHTNNFRDFTSAKHLACYSEVVPFANESGTIVKKHRVSKMANMKLKTLLHLAAMAAVRQNRTQTILYQKSNGWKKQNVSDQRGAKQARAPYLGCNPKTNTLHSSTRISINKKHLTFNIEIFVFKKTDLLESTEHLS